MAERFIVCNHRPMGHTIRVMLSGSREGAYIVTEEHPDGSLVVVPDRSKKARLPVDVDEPESRGENGSRLPPRSADR